MPQGQPFSVGENTFTVAGNEDEHASQPPSGELRARTKSAQQDIAQEVDTMILDYQVHRTIESVLRLSASNRPSSHVAADENPTMLWKWLSVYNSRHTAHIHDPDIRLRLHTARFLVLYCYRATDGHHSPPYTELVTLRDENWRRAEKWIGSEDRVPSLSYAARNKLEEALPFDDDTIKQSRQTQLTALGGDINNTKYGTAASLSLLDMLPLFMSICAAFYDKEDASPSLATFSLMIDMIRQAYLEQYLINGGASGCDPIDEAFSWGCYDEVIENEDDPVEYQVDRMFRDRTTAEENSDWQHIRSMALGELMLDIGLAEPVHARLIRLAIEFPFLQFDKRLKEFLTELTASLEPPVLVQLESGCLLGMTPEETAAFLQDCGISQTQWSSIEEWYPW